MLNRNKLGRVGSQHAASPLAAQAIRGMSKKHLSESDICDKFIRPAMVAAGWNGMDQVYREFPLRADCARPQAEVQDLRAELKATLAQSLGGKA